MFSAITLATVNVTVKRGSDILLGRVVLSTAAALIVLPLTFVVPAPDRATVMALALATPVHFCYQYCLVQAMTRGELTLVFPVMRGVSPLLTALSVMVFLGQRLPAVGWIGLAVATGAVIAFAWPPRGTSLRAHPDKKALFWAAGTAVGVALYNATDTHGVHVAPRPETFIVWVFLLDPILISITAFVTRPRFAAELRAIAWTPNAIAGLLSVLSFGASLYAFTLAETAKVSALRETAVVWAALMGRRMLGEGAGLRRVLAAIALAGGLILLQFG